MPTAIVSIPLPMQGVTTYTASEQLPFAPATVAQIQFHWGDLPSASKIELWTQPGDIAIDPTDAGANLITKFTLPATGVKTRSSNKEFPCKTIPQDHRYAFFRYTGAITTTHCACILTLEH